MTAGPLQGDLDALIAEHGEFNAYNFKLGDDVYTRGDPATTYADARVLTMVQLAADLVRRPFEDMRVLDLGSLEGLFGLEFAARGATVVGIEGRPANVARAQFVTNHLGLADRVDWQLGDARDLRVDQHGRFDVVMCLGLLYHLDGPDLLPFLQRMAECCSGITIIDTHVSVTPADTITSDKQTYHGRWYAEHDVQTSISDRLKATRSSLDNERSFWLTVPSLVNGLKDVGFTTVVQLPPVPELAGVRDRVQLIAVAGEVVRARIEPNTYDLGRIRMPERDARPIHKSQDPTYKLRQAVSRYLPERARVVGRQARGRLAGWRSRL
jgi:predicted RNA methylase